MKNIYSTTIFMFLISFASMGQKLEFSINAGANSTFIPDFSNTIIIANDGLIIPGLINYTNSQTVPLLLKTKSKTFSKFGYMIQFEINKKIKEKLDISFSLGVNSLNYEYVTFIDVPGTPYKELDKSSDNYGNPNLIYVNIRPISVSYSLMQNKLKLSAGPAFNFLVNSKHTKNVIVYNGDVIQRVYFEQTNDFNSLLYGFSVKSSYRIMKQCNLFVSYQHYFNSIYSTKNNTYKVGKECKPNILEFGVGYSF